MRAREVQYEQPEYSDWGFPIVFHSDYMDQSRKSIYTNWHIGIEVLYCTQGRGRVLRDSQEESFGPGDLVIIDSNVIHALHLADVRCDYYCMIIEPAFLGAHGFEMEQLRIQTVVRDADAIGHYQKVIDSFARMDAFHKPVVLTSVLLLFLRLLRHYRGAAPAPPRPGANRSHHIIVEALNYIREHLSEPMCIEQISRHVGMSKYYFCRQFLAYTGTTITHHINTLKCDMARKLLRENGFNVSEAAHHLGFTNLSYFSKLYRKHVGVLPSVEQRQREDRATRNNVFEKA